MFQRVSRYIHAGTVFWFHFHKRVRRNERPRTITKLHRAPHVLSTKSAHNARTSFTVLLNDSRVGTKNDSSGHPVHRNDTKLFSGSRNRTNRTSLSFVFQTAVGLRRIVQIRDVTTCPFQIAIRHAEISIIVHVDARLKIDTR